MIGHSYPFLIYWPRRRSEVQTVVLQFVNEVAHDIYIIGRDDIGLKGHLFDLPLLGVGHAGQEVQQTAQGPRPDLLFEEEEKAKKSDTQPDGQKQKIEFEKGLRTVRKEAKKKAREEKKKQEPIEMSRKDKLAVILAFCELLLPLAIGVMAIFAFLIWFLGKFWLHAW